MFDFEKWKIKKKYQDAVERLSSYVKADQDGRDDSDALAGARVDESSPSSSQHGAAPAAIHTEHMYEMKKMKSGFC